MKIKNLLVLAIFLLNLITLNAYVVKLEVLENESNNNSQFIINAGDCHFGCCATMKHDELSNQKIAEINANHAKNIISFSEQFPKNESLFILEDIYDYQGFNDYIKNYINETRINCENKYFTNCMSYITDICKQKNIPVKNVEFRNSAFLVVHKKLLPVSVFLKDFDEIINEINGYIDGKEINEYYKELTEIILNNNKNILEILRKNSDKQISEFKHSKEEINNFMLDYYLLIDARIIHTILQNKDKKYIFICAGNNHLEAVNNALKQINYNQKYISINNDIRYPIHLQSHLNRINIEVSSNTEFPYVLTFIILILILTIQFPTRFRIIHFHYLKRRLDNYEN